LPARAGRDVRRGAAARPGRTVPAHADRQQRDPVRVAAHRDPQPLRASAPRAGPVPRLAGPAQVPASALRGPHCDRLGSADRGGHLPPRAAGLPRGLARHDRRAAGGAGVAAAADRRRARVAERTGPAPADRAEAGPVDIFRGGRGVSTTMGSKRAVSDDALDRGRDLSGATKSIADSVSQAQSVASGQANAAMAASAPRAMSRDSLETLAFALASALFLYGVHGAFSFPANHDMAWLLYVAGRALDGATLYVDVIEINP